MTNHHVVDGADEIYVTLTDKREFKAKLIGSDQRTDVALVKIDSTDLPSLKVGDPNRVRVGEWVLAIGSPFGLESTVTAGIVSAKGRETGDYLPFIQTDVAVNPGNSGGPLLNMRGEVVGINSQIYSRTGGFMGISFAIPIDEAIRVSDQLRLTGRVTRGRIGVGIAEVTKDIAEPLGLDKPGGALVRSVEQGGPAEKAGIEVGDIIRKFADRQIERSSDLPRIVGNTKPSTAVPMEIWRRGAIRTITVTVAEMTPDRTAGVGPRGTPVPEKPAGQGQLARGRRLRLERRAACRAADEGRRRHRVGGGEGPWGAGRVAGRGRAASGQQPGHPVCRAVQRGRRQARPAQDPGGAGAPRGIRPVHPDQAVAAAGWRCVPGRRRPSHTIAVCPRTGPRPEALARTVRPGLLLGRVAISGTGSSRAVRSPSACSIFATSPSSRISTTASRRSPTG
jgi:S1-C subfamily serine protease